MSDTDVAIGAIAALQRQVDGLQTHNEVLYRDNVAISEVADALRAEVEALTTSLDANWVTHQRVVKAEARVAELEMALNSILLLPKSYGKSMWKIAFKALRGEVGNG